MKDLGFNERGELEANIDDEETMNSSRNSKLYDDEDNSIELSEITIAGKSNSTSVRNTRTDSTLDSMDKEIEI